MLLRSLQVAHISLLSVWLLRRPFPTGELGSDGVQPVPASLVLCDPTHGPCPKLILTSVALQLPVVSVVRDAESQLLPDVGAVVTCKVGHWSALR